MRREAAVSQLFLETIDVDARDVGGVQSETYEMCRMLHDLSLPHSLSPSVFLKVKPCAKSDSGRTFRSFEEEGRVNPLCTKCKASDRLFVLTKNAAGTGPSGACVPWGGRGKVDKGSVHSLYTDPLLAVTTRCRLGQQASLCAGANHFRRLANGQFVRIGLANIKCFNKEVAYRWFGMMNPDQGFMTVTGKDTWKRSKDVHMRLKTWRVMTWAYRSCSRVIKGSNGKRGGRVCQTSKSSPVCFQANGYKNYRDNSLSGYVIVDCSSTEVFGFLLASA